MIDKNIQLEIGGGMKEMQETFLLENPEGRAYVRHGNRVRVSLRGSDEDETIVKNSVSLRR